MKPVIGVTPQFDVEQNRHWVRPNYFSALQREGALPVVLSFLEDDEDAASLAARCDGFLFTGGPDPLPELYGEETLPFCGAIDARRDALEFALLREVLSLGKPVLGICRGIQVINAALGGSLWQDIPAQVQGAVLHAQQPPFDSPVHRVRVERASPLFSLLGEEPVVNSMHHQAVKKLAPGLCCAARAPDGLVEALYGPEFPFLAAVQWHPEYLCENAPRQRALFAAFAAACRR